MSQSTDHSWVNTLLEAARERNIVLSAAEVRAIRASQPQSPLAQWVRRNLIVSTSKSTLLSAEELELWQHVKESKCSSAEAASVVDFSIPTTDEEFWSATKDLNAQTQDLERRCQVLESQSALAGRLRDSVKSSRASRAKHTRYFDQKEAAGVQHVKFANAQLLETLQADIQAEFQIVGRDVKSAHAIVAETLNADDRALEGFNEIFARQSNREQAEFDIDSLEKRVSELTATLRHFRVQMIKDRLDRTYLETLARESNLQEDEETAGSSSTSAQNDDDEAIAIKSLQDDLGSLYPEIDDVATMVVTQAHSRAIDSTLRDVQRLKAEEGRVRNELLYTGLSNMTTTLDDLSSKLENIQSRRLSLDEIRAKCQDIRADGISSATSIGRPRQPTRTDSSGSHRPNRHDAATSALLHHFGLSEGMNQGTASADHQIQNFATRMSRQSADNVDHILRLVEAAATRGNKVIQSLENVLGAKSTVGFNLDSELQLLEERINDAKADMEATLNLGATTTQLQRR
ncbi:hypothetical protein ABEF93_008001 [Exophiala dermatitidis]